MTMSLCRVHGDQRQRKIGFHRLADGRRLAAGGQFLEAPRNIGIEGGDRHLAIAEQIGAASQSLEQGLGKGAVLLLRIFHRKRGVGGGSEHDHAVFRARQVIDHAHQIARRLDRSSPHAAGTAGIDEQQAAGGERSQRLFNLGIGESGFHQLRRVTVMGQEEIASRGIVNAVPGQKQGGEIAGPGLAPEPCQTVAERRRTGVTIGKNAQMHLAIRPAVCPAIPFGLTIAPCATSSPS